MHPIILEIPWLGLPIYSYGMMLGISFIVGWYLTLHFAQKDGIDRQVSSTAMTLGIVGAILGARILYFVTNPGTMNSLVDFFAFNRGGLVAYGGFIGGVGAATIYLYRKRVAVLRFCDHAAPGIALGTAITRIGCLLYGCCYGALTKMPWGLSFPKGAPAYNHHLREGLIDATAHGSLAVHPTQIHESLYGLLIFGVLLMFRRVKSRAEGMVFLLFVALYAIFRSINEMFRSDTQRGSVGFLSTSQFIGLVTLILSVGGMIYLYKHGKKVRSATGAASVAASSAGDTQSVRPQSRPARKKGKKKKKNK